MGLSGIILNTAIKQGGKVFKSALHTKPMSQTDSILLKYIRPNVDNLKLSEKATFLKKLFQNHETSQIKIGSYSGNPKTFTKFEDSRMGSNPAFWAKDNKSGELYYVKCAKNDDPYGRHLQSEVSASKLYNLAGIQTPEVSFLQLEDGTKCTLSKYSEGLNDIDKSINVKDGFAADAWLANWDSLIGGNSMAKGGKIFKMDNGGALEFRAQGKLKPNFGEKVDELVSLTDGRNWASSAAYKNMTDKDLIRSFKKVTSISDAQIQKACYDGELADILIARRNYMSKVLAEMEKTPFKGGSLSEYFKAIENKIKIPQKEYQDIIQNMTAQRKNMLHIRAGKLYPVDKQIAHYKEFYIGENRQNREIIGDALEDKDVHTAAKELSRENNLDGLISQGCIPRAVSLYRGGSAYDFGLAKMSSKDFIEMFYKKGRTFRIPIYPETSLKKSIAQNYTSEGRIVYKYNVPAGTKGIYMENLGMAKGGWNGINEEEILLPRNLIGKFKSCTEENGRYIVEIDILPHKPFFKKVHEFWKEMIEK